MNVPLKQTGQKWMNWAVNSPKKFFVSAMILLSVSLITSLIHGIFFPSETIFRIKPPKLYSESQTTQNKVINQEKAMEKIVKELENLKVKRDQKYLQKEDSLRIEYLYNQYQQLKNEH